MIKILLQSEEIPFLGASALVEFDYILKFLHVPALLHNRPLITLLRLNREKPRLLYLGTAFVSKTLEILVTLMVLASC